MLYTTVVNCATGPAGGAVLDSAASIGTAMSLAAGPDTAYAEGFALGDADFSSITQPSGNVNYNFV